MVLKRKCLVFTHFLAISFFIIISYLPSVCLAFKVILDAGHGGVDKGAVYGAAKESVVVLNISNKIKELLEKNQFQVIMTRTKEEFVSLQKRVFIAQQNSGDIFLSIHANASTDKRAKGIEFFLQSTTLPTSKTLRRRHFYSDSVDINSSAKNTSHWSYLNNSVDSSDSNEFSDDFELSKKKDIEKILVDLKQNIKFKKSIHLSSTLKKGLPGMIKQAPFFVLMQTPIPSILIEVGFLSYPKENKKLLTEEYQNELAEKVFNSVQSYSQRFINHLEPRTL